MNALTNQINRLQIALSRLPDGDRAEIESEIAEMFDLQQSIAQAALQGMIGERDSAIESLVKLEDAIYYRDKSNPMIRDLIHEVTEEAYENGEDHGYGEGQDEGLSAAKREVAEAIAIILERDKYSTMVLANALFDYSKLQSDKYAHDLLADLLKKLKGEPVEDIYVWVDEGDGEEW